MLTGLNRYVYAPIAALMLWAVVLAVSPAMANAQATHHAQAQQAIEVVAPGDSLWSISAKWLGPDASAQQIAEGVERIYALNRNRIGTDPNRLIVGQKLRLPSAVERQSPESELARAARTREAAGAALAEANREPRQSADARPEAAPLPELARATPVPAVRPLNSHSSPPSLAQSFASEARSSFASVVAGVRETIPREEYAGRRLLGGALLAVSSVLAIILVLYVARELWGPRYARRRAQAPWVSGYASAKYDSGPDLLLRESGQWKRGKAITLLPPRSYVAPRDELPEPHTPVAHSANGEPPQMLSTRSSQEWEIGEPLRRALGSIPLHPGTYQRHALSEVKPLSQDALATLALLERRRQPTSKELRQARALQGFLAALEEEEAVYPGYQARYAAPCSEASDPRSSAPQLASSGTGLEPSTNGSKAEDTATENAGTGKTGRIKTTRQISG